MPRREAPPVVVSTTAQAQMSDERYVGALLTWIYEQGVRKVYWRVQHGGFALYPSKVAEPLHRPEPEPGSPKDRAAYGFLTDLFSLYTFGTFDSLKAACKWARVLGMEIHAWWTLVEEAHAVPPVARFALEHPEYQEVNLRGERLRSRLCFFHEGVRRYKLRVLAEILARGFDGVMLDFWRRGLHEHGRLVDERNVSILGFDPLILKAFESRHGFRPDAEANADPRWIRYRADYITELVRRLAKQVHARRKPVAALVHPAHNLEAGLLDVERWGREGLVDNLIPWFRGGYFDGIGPGMAAKGAVARDARAFRKLKTGKAAFCPGLAAYGKWEPAQMLADGMLEAAQAGAKEIVVFEHPVLRQNNAGGIVAGFQNGHPHPLRAVKAGPVARAPGLRGGFWRGAAWREGFQRHSKTPGLGLSGFKTAFRVAWDRRAVYVAWRAERMAPGHELAFVVDPWNERIYYMAFLVTGAGAFRFGVSRDDPAWRPRWQVASAWLGRTFQALMTIPWKAMGLKPPRKAFECGANFTRSVPGEGVSGWFAPGPVGALPPATFGRLRFER
ncbi:MAG: family 10 glycosylhydrolase [Planctomycetota bacterium]|nr:family 10 glycosylhydrolase [Planctomycetota bacterium]